MEKLLKKLVDNAMKKYLSPFIFACRQNYN